jgi:carbon monoxide dehydrogenase subunit G
MTKFESSPKTITADRKNVFSFLSDINNFRSLIPEDQVRDFESEQDNCHFHVDGLGEIGIRIYSREPDEFIRFESEGSKPFRFDLLVHLDELEENTTKMRLIFNADLNMMMRMMAKKPIEEGLEKIATQLSDHLNRHEWA